MFGEVGNEGCGEPGVFKHEVLHEPQDARSFRKRILSSVKIHGPEGTRTARSFFLFEEENARSGASKIVSGNESVNAPTDDNRVVTHAFVPATFSAEK